MAQTKLGTTKYNGFYIFYVYYLRIACRCWNDSKLSCNRNFILWNYGFLLTTCKTISKGGLILLLSSCVASPSTCELRPSVETDNYILTTSDSLQLSSHYLLFCINCLIEDLK